MVTPGHAKAQMREQPTRQLYVTPYLWSSGISGISGISGTTQAGNRRLPEQTASSEFTWQLLATVDYRLGDGMVLRLGYRHLPFQRSGDSLRQNMGMSGPILGSTLRF